MEERHTLHGDLRYTFVPPQDNPLTSYGGKWGKKKNTP